MTKKSVTKKPNNEVALPQKPKRTFSEHDRFNRIDFAKNLTKAIKTFSPFYEDAYVLSLNAPFGSGKTTFVEMWQSMLEEEEMTCVYLNAWEHDFDDEPIVPILSTLLQLTPEHTELKKAAFAAMASTANDLIIKGVGVDIKKAVTEASLAGDINAAGEVLYKDYHFKQKALHTLRTNLSEYAQSLSNKPLIIFVDELDRARPDYSVRFLETIKHMFPIKGICFVLSVDKGQLEKSVSQMYGDIKFEDYYLRFITSEANLPELDKVKNLTPFLDDLKKEFIGEKQEQGVKFPFKQSDERHITEFLIKICKGFELKPRQIQRLYREFSKFMAVEHENTSFGRLNWINASAFLIALKLKDQAIYEKLVKDKLKPADLHSFLKSCSFKTANGKIFLRPILSLTFAFMLTDNNLLQMEIFDVYDKEDYSHKKEENPDTCKSNIIKSLSQSLNDFGEVHENSTFNHIHDLMESWSSFLK